MFALNAADAPRAIAVAVTIEVTSVLKPFI
jgi:hypothetical protein